MKEYPDGIPTVEDYSPASQLMKTSNGMVQTPPDELGGSSDKKVTNADPISNDARNMSPMTGPGYESPMGGPTGVGSTPIAPSAHKR